MSATRLEFDRFLLWLSQQHTSADVRRFANSISAHLAEIAATTTAQGQRARTVVRLLLRDFETVGDALRIPEDIGRAAAVPWRRLMRLDVGPFRGFTAHQPLDLAKRVVLIYGPNGTGKSSLCEAIEFAFTGAVAEASAKRMGDEEYCANAHVRAFSAPTLIASDAAGAEYVVDHNPEALRFCVVERNRIDEFSRISARTPREQARSIAALFGVEQFDDFVANFNESIDAHLDLSGKNAFALSVKRTAIDADSRLVATAGEKREDLDRRDAQLAAEFGEGYAIDKLRQWIGEPGHPGRLAELAGLLERPAPLAIGVSPETTRVLREALANAAGRLRSIEEQLHARQREVSYKQLFEAVRALQKESPDRCPACETLLVGAKIARDPYERASKGLAELEELARLEAQHAEATAAFTLASRGLRAELYTAVTSAASAGIDEVYIERVTSMDFEPDPAAWRELDAISIGELSFWSGVDAFTTQIAAYDSEVREDAKYRAALREERNRLQQFDRGALELKTIRDDFEASLTQAAQRVTQFEAENKALIAAAEAEKPLIARNQRINAAYDRFLSMLRQYRDELPGKLLAGLNTITRDLYNAFNRDDHEADKLAVLRLPTAPDLPLEVSFADHPEMFFGALHVLSEGHIRCLGLSILVAKIIQQGCPVMIFDDAVNAIDDDHRNGICKTLFEDDWLRDRQIILTCHGEEFIKTIQRDLGAEVVAHDSLLYVFKPRDGDRRLNLDTRPRTRNYILLSRQSLDRLEIRDALAHARRALEGNVDRLWQWLSKRGRGELRLTFKGYGAHGELRNLTEALLRDLNAQEFEHARKQPMQAALTQLLGVQPGSIEWLYLNSGTHEASRYEFDRAVVRTIVEGCEALDRALSQ